MAVHGTGDEQHVPWQIRTNTGKTISTHGGYLAAKRELTSAMHAPGNVGKVVREQVQAGLLGLCRK